MFVALQYKLWVFGVPIDGPANVLGLNCGVVSKQCEHSRVNVDEKTQC
jgi:hypothetical protein